MVLGSRRETYSVTSLNITYLKVQTGMFVGWRLNSKKVVEPIKFRPQHE